MSKMFMNYHFASISVKNACFSRVDPTPLSSPKTVVYSSSAMRLLNLPQSELERDEFPRFVGLKSQMF